MSLGGVYRHWGRVYVLRECMRAWSIGWGGVFRRSLQALGKGLCVEGVYEGVVYRLGGVFRRSLQALGKGLCVEGVYEGVVYRLGVCL